MVRISWTEAFDEITHHLLRIRGEYGPQSVLYFSGSGTKGLLNGVGTAFWRLFGGYTGTYGDLCWPAGLEATRLTLGDNKHSAPWDLAHARLILLWGKNSAETNIHQMPFVETAVEAGARLVVVDPRRTETADRADLLVQPRPGSDGALALALAHILFRDDMVDEAFLDAHVVGHESYREAVQDCTPEWAEKITGVPSRFIERLGVSVGTVKPLTICAGFGMQRYTNSGQTMRAIIALLALTGNIGRPGAGWQFANLQSAIFDEVKDPIAFYPPEKPDGVARISISTARLGADMLATADPPLKMAWVERGNPVTQNPDTSTVLKAFRRLDFRVVVEQFPHRHGARGGHRPARQDALRAVRRHRGLLASLHPAQAESPGSARAGEAGVGDLPPAGRAPRSAIKCRGCGHSRAGRCRDRYMARGEAGPL